MGALLDALGFGGPMKRSERQAWASATSLHALAIRTAAWLRGDLKSQPSYYGPCDVDEADGLLEALIRLNHGGFLTSNSQEGFDGIGDDGAHWTQLASVTGFAHRAATAAVRGTLRGTRFRVFDYPCKTSRWGRGANGVVVTRREGRPFTTFGGQLTKAEVAFLYTDCSEEAVQDVCRARQVTVYDPEPSRNDLWPALLRMGG